ncbi:DDB1- and CUL4-associated factor 8 isoform X2 [Olea europaea subsp. europaea]|uniref:DDB1- and CUL4-associated factor 8 isoform X2 n=2 Tax=Olea europaea subsp. europaea TaxID=158383 RepID=A0A8S0TLQ8_OLEEU|nr:DDB1- and CUL4-associated factor 8 isoform X2 [Olea europaea subsp. europaea]
MTRKKVGTSLDAAVVDVWKREVGALSTRNFARRFAASVDLVLRLDILLKLEKHRGCVNTVSFNADGDVLVSGSDDRRIMLWDWEIGRVNLSFHSGHHNNVFQAKIMPYTEDRSIVTCAADGQVRHAQILERGEVKTKLLGRHQGAAHKLSIEPGSPHLFYTCGEDGMVQHVDLRTGTAAELFTCQPIESQRFMSIIHLNAIAIDPRNPNILTVGGSDQFARLFDIRKCKVEGSTDFGQPVDFFSPPHLVDDEDVGITGVAFSEQSELLVSYSDEFIYLFSRDMGLGPDPLSTSQVFHGNDAGDTSPVNHSVASSSDMDADRKASPKAYKGHRNCETVKGVSFFGPNSEYVVSGSDCGRIFIWKKGGELIRVMEADKHVVNCIESHPHTMVLASSGIESDIKIWIPKAIDRATLPTDIQKDRVLNFTPRLFGFFPPFGVYDDNESDDDGDDDDYDTDDEDEDEDDNEVETDEQEEEEDREEDDGEDFIFLQDTDEHDNEIDGSEDFYDDEEEDSSESEEMDYGNDSADD